VARKTSSFRRPVARYKPQPRVLILCEDSKSCLDYLADAARHFRASAEVEIAHCGRTDPIGIVNEAITRLRQYDEVYCAIDRDNHESFSVAEAAAQEFAIRLIASFPCYEFWLLLHFRSTRAPHQSVGALSAGDRMVRTLRNEQGMQDYAKGAATGLFESLRTRLPAARTRAAATLAAALAEGEMNPSTRIHELIALFEKLGTVIAISDPDSR
jgi:hypothetical protein